MFTVENNFYRVRPVYEGNFQLLSNNLMSKYKLSESAVIMLYWVNSLPLDWYFTVTGASTSLRWGARRVRNTLAELAEKGFLHRESCGGRSAKNTISETGKNVGGNFCPDTFTFYMLPEDNPFFSGFSSICQMDDHGEPLLNNNKNSCNSQSVRKKLTDEQQQKEIQQKNFAELTSLIETKTAESKKDLKTFVPQVVEHLKTAITSGKIDFSAVMDKLNAICAVEGSLVKLMSRLRHQCKTALKRLKCPAARKSYLASVVCGQLEKYTPKAQDDAPKNPAPEKHTPKTHEVNPEGFYEMLCDMEYPHAKGCPEWQKSSIFKSPETLDGYAEDSDLKKCRIPEKFAENPATLEQALQLLTGYPYLPTDTQEQADYKAFVGSTLSTLAYSIHRTKNTAVIAKLNSINVGKSGYDKSLQDLMHRFFEHFKEKALKYSGIKSGKECYIAKMLENYILHEYCADVAFDVAVECSQDLYALHSGRHSPRSGRHVPYPDDDGNIIYLTAQEL